MSVFPAGVNVASTWDRNAAFARGAAMGSEHRGKGVDIQLAVSPAYRFVNSWMLIKVAGCWTPGPGPSWSKELGGLLS